MESPVAKKATRRFTRCRSASVILWRKSLKSVEKSTSSTVQVFLIAALYMSKKTGYFIGRKVRFIPGSRIIFYTPSRLLAGFTSLWTVEGTGNGTCCYGRGGCGLGNFGGRTGTKVICRLQSLLPGIDVHGRQLADIRCLREQVQ